MPVCHLVIHAYGTWMPDRPEGYYHHALGYREQDVDVADRYRERQAEPAARFDVRAQRLLVQTLIDAAGPQRLTIYAVASDEAHLHVLVGWTDGRTGDAVHDRLKQSLARGLNAAGPRRRWFVRKGWVERVSDEAHFGTLAEEYLPSHRGWGWHWRRGWIPPRGTDREPLARG